MADSTGKTVEFSIHFKSGKRGRQKLVVGKATKPAKLPAGRTPRVSKLMALARKMDDILNRGEIKDYAELAMLSHVSRARITQIMNLLNLAPDIQEALLFLPNTSSRYDKIKIRHMQPITRELSWHDQRNRWRKFLE